MNIQNMINNEEEDATRLIEVLIIPHYLSIFGRPLTASLVTSCGLGLCMCGHTMVWMG